MRHGGGRRPQKRGAHAAASARRPWRLTYHAEILLISLASLLIEISYTRIISYKLFYYYVYLVIGLALLGVGAGGVLVAVSKRLRNAATDTILFWSFFVGAVATVAAYLIIAFIKINTLAVWLYGTSASAKSLVMLLVLCLCLFVSFVPAGIISATLFSRRPKEIGGLYFADLLGAGIACAVVIYVISSRRGTGHRDAGRGRDGGRRVVVGPAYGPCPDRIGHPRLDRRHCAQHRAGSRFPLSASTPASRSSSRAHSSLPAGVR